MNHSIELTDQQMEEYLEVALANGFSKGTANVSPTDMKKLKGILNKYRKAKHPFRACVKDNRKRFGARTEAVCAVLKDLIKGTTKWRSTERKKVNASEEGAAEFILSDEDRFEIELSAEDYPEGHFEEFMTWLSELTEEEAAEIAFEGEEVPVELEAGDVAWKSSDSYNHFRRQIETKLNEFSDYGMTYWVEDMNKNEALVCERGLDYWVVPYSVAKGGRVALGEDDDWKPVERAWVESNVSLSSREDVMAELYFTDSELKTDEDGNIWKTFLREGTWKYSPENGRPVPKPLTVIPEGKSDPSKKVISMTDVMANFERGVKQHVTVPTSHKDEPFENTGFVRKLRYGKDENGKTTLEAAMDFTEPDIKEKVLRGTIANVSGGILLDYIDKESGKKYDAVLGHVALTNKPWIQGMMPFEDNASENLKVVAFSEEPETIPVSSGGGEPTVTTPETETTETPAFLQEIGLSEDEVKDRLAKFAEFEKRDKQNKVDNKVREWEEAKKAPALIAAAKSVLMADEGEKVVNLSEEGQTVSLSASEIVERLVAAAPTVNLTDDPVTDQDTEGDRPNDDTTEENLSQEEKVLANQLFLEEGYSEEDAVAEAKKRLASNNS